MIFSIVCVYNNEKILNDFLIKGLSNQTVDFELIKIDNTKGVFKSAAEALNYGGKKATGEYIIFIHQDVCFLSNDWLEKALGFLNKIPDLGIAGVAGMTKGKLGGIFRVGTIPLENKTCFIYHGPDKEFIKSSDFTTPIEVQTLDEQLLIIPQKVFNNNMFDEKVCSGWHLYGVEYSLSIKKIGLKAYVLPIELWHMSKGSVNKGYYDTLNKIIKKHKEEIIIYTTCGVWRTSRFLNFAGRLLLAVRGQIGCWLKRHNYEIPLFVNKIKIFLVGGRE